MPDLPSLLTTAANQLRPDHTPDFAVIIRRSRSRQRARRIVGVTLGCCALLLAVLFASTQLPRPTQSEERLGSQAASTLAPAATDAARAPISTTATYRVSFDASAFSDADGAGVRGCGGLPGVQSGGVLLSQPPQFNFKVSGDQKLLDDFEKCVGAVASARLARLDG